MRPGFADGIAVVIAAATGGIATWAIDDWLDLQGTTFEDEEFNFRLLAAALVAFIFFFPVRVILYRYLVA